MTTPLLSLDIFLVRLAAVMPTSDSVAHGFALQSFTVINNTFENLEFVCLNVIYDLFCVLLNESLTNIKLIE